MRFSSAAFFLVLSLPAFAASAEPPSPAAASIAPPPPPAPSADAADAAPSLAQVALQRLITRQQKLLAEAARENHPRFDEDAWRHEMQGLCNDYDDFLKKYPDTAAGYAAYGVLLGKIDMRRQAAAMLLKANALDANLPLVKNQLGNYLAEEGKPLEAVNYYLAAIRLAPQEPLYHYQLGLLLYEARDDFLKSGAWQRSSLDGAMLDAFRQAATLAPDRIEFTYRYGEAFYDLDKPDWDTALKVWGELEPRLKPGVEQQTIRLHAANVLLKQGKLDHARALLATVDEAVLAKQKEKLVAQLPETAKK